jgi:hypothetical protein
MIRLLFRVVKVVATLYGFWSMLTRRRWLAVGFALWRFWRRRPARNPALRAQWMFVNAGEPAIYRRRGTRRLWRQGSNCP